MLAILDPPRQSQPEGGGAVAGEMIPASPSTPAQHDRYQRILAAATAMLASGGEDALQMKELAERAIVSLATLYRYFPSKDYLLLAISQARYENALRRVRNEPPRGVTVQERITSHLLREFRAEQRDQRLTAALTRVLTDTRPEYAPFIARTSATHMAVIEHIATGGEPVSEELRRRLLIADDVFGAATRRWLAGVSSAADARFEIRVGCYLLGDMDEEAAS
jgi:TetR/AcrR family transcriptional regulator, cholesterol catabolism regulator